MKNKLAILAAASALTISSCMFPAQTGFIREREEEYYLVEEVPSWKFKDAFQNHRFGHFYYMCEYYSYPARAGDDLFRLYLQEGGGLKDKKEWEEFQKGIFRETKKHGCQDCLKWQDSTLAVAKDGLIMIPDANKNGLPGD